MPISLLTSPPGTGKTLKSVEIIFKKLSEGYIVYSNIIGLKIPGVLSLEFNADWRDLDSFKRSMPEHADKPIFVLIDECHEWFCFGSQFNKTKIKEIREEAEESKKQQFLILKKTKQRFSDILASIRGEKPSIVSDDEVDEPFFISAEEYSVYEEQRAALSMHRHFGFDFLLVTQEVSKLNKTVRDFISVHMHMRRPFNLPYATIYHFREVQDNLGILTLRSAERKERFKYPKWLFNFYTSTNINTIKSSPPWFWIAVLSIPALFLIWFLYGLFAHGLFNSNDTQKPTEKTTSVATANTSASSNSGLSVRSTNLVSTNISLQQEEYRRPAMVIESSSECRVFNSSGDRIVTDDATCKKLSSRTTNLSFSKLDRSSLHSHTPEAKSENNQTTSYDDPSLYNTTKTYS